ncbi:MAG: hemerythrin domain-containing protein [Bacteroidales bacterium]|nr:hemerythrin domain-containing protein [Bacteroidales bacterium]
MKMAGNNTLTADTKLSDAVSTNPFLLLLLEHFDIELPLQEKSLREVAVDHLVSPDLLLTIVNMYNDLHHVLLAPVTSDDISAIIKYLRNSHRYYSEEIYPDILMTISEMSQPGNLHETKLVKKFFDEYFSEVKVHLDYENETVFPYITHLHDRLTGKAIPGDVSNYSVAEYREHHDDIEEKLDDLKNLLIQYLPMKEGRVMRRKLLFSLFELEHDLKIHSRIEDFILIPLVASMEEQVKGYKA